MTQLNGQPGELHFTIQVKRAATGKVDEYQMVGFLDPDKLAEFQSAQQQEQQDGTDHQ